MVSAACAACKAWRRWSTTCSETALVWTSDRPRSSSRLASSALARASAKLAGGLFGDRLERTRVDDIEQVAGTNHVAVPELDSGHEAADAGANLDFLDRLEASGEFVPVGDGAFHRLRHRNRRRGGGRRRWRLVAAARQRQCHQRDQRPQPAQRNQPAAEKSQSPCPAPRISMVQSRPTSNSPALPDIIDRLRPLPHRIRGGGHKCERFPVCARTPR